MVNNIPWEMEWFAPDESISDNDMSGTSWDFVYLLYVCFVVYNDNKYIYYRTGIKYTFTET